MQDAAVHFKGPGDLVTDADTASEELIVARIRKAFPNATILAEESGLSERAQDETFVVDPIDGTTNFAHGYPMFCVSIAYQRNGATEAGAIYAPALGELFLARRGNGATLNGKKIRVSSTSDLAAALLCTGFSPTTYARNADVFDALYRRCLGVRHDGSAALNLAFVAAGRFDGFWEYCLKPWDYAAGALLVEEAGGHVVRRGSDSATAMTMATNAHIAKVLGDVICEFA